MIFLTVGTQFPFERLIRAVDKACADGIFEDELFGQIGQSSYQPRNFNFTVSVDGDEFGQYVRSSSAIISHAGIGTITMALENNKPMLAMPRLSRYGEVVNDHQLDLARRFEKGGHILVAYSDEDVAIKGRRLCDFVPRSRLSSKEAVISRVEKFLKQIQLSRVSQ